MSDDYERRPLFQYTPTYSRYSLRFEKPHELKDKSLGGAELKHLVYKVNGTWDIEYCVVENLEPFLKAAKAFGWRGVRLFDQYEVTLECTALDDFLVVRALPEFQRDDLNGHDFLMAWQKLMEKIFNCKKQRDVQYRMFNREMVTKPKRLDPHTHEKRIRVMFRIQDLLQEGDQPLATDKQKCIWYFYTYCTEDRKEFVEKPLDPANCEIPQITEFMKTCFERKVRKKEIIPYTAGEYQCILNQQISKRRDQVLRSGDEPEDPMNLPIPRKPRNRRRSKSPRDHRARNRRSEWRDRRQDNGEPGWRRGGRRGRDYQQRGRRHEGGRQRGYGGRHGDRRGYGGDNGRNRDGWNRGRNNDRRRDDRRRDDRRRDGDRGRRDERREEEAHFQSGDEEASKKERSRSPSLLSRRDDDEENSNSSRSRSRSTSRSEGGDRFESYAVEQRKESDADEEVVLPKNPKKEKQKRARKDLKRRRSGNKGFKILFAEDSDDEDDFHTPRSQQSRAKASGF